MLKHKLCILLYVLMYSTVYYVRMYIDLHYIHTYIHVHVRTVHLHTCLCNTHSMDPYDRLIWEVWMPKLRATIGRWSPRDCDPLIALLETWMPLIPSWVTDNILDQFVLPRVQREVESWDPTTDTMPIHSWIHPWFPLMGMCMYMYTCTVQVIKKCPDVLSVLLTDYTR